MWHCCRSTGTREGFTTHCSQKSPHCLERGNAARSSRSLSEPEPTPSAPSPRLRQLGTAGDSSAHEPSAGRGQNQAAAPSRRLPPGEAPGAADLFPVLCKCRVRAGAEAAGREQRLSSPCRAQLRTRGCWSCSRSPGSPFWTMSPRKGEAKSLSADLSPSTNSSGEIQEAFGGRVGLVAAVPRSAVPTFQARDPSAPHCCQGRLQFKQGRSGSRWRSRYDLH